APNLTMSGRDKWRFLGIRPRGREGRQDRPPPGGARARGREAPAGEVLGGFQRLTTAGGGPRAPALRGMGRAAALVAPNTPAHPLPPPELTPTSFFSPALANTSSAAFTAAPSANR